MRMRKLPAGTVLYHGTSSQDFDETEDHLEGPAWVSDSDAVAERFALRNAQRAGSRPRVLTYRLEEDVDLYEMNTPAECDELAETHGIDFGGVEEMRESVDSSGIEGWIIPRNYPEGADIMLANPRALTHTATRALPSAPAPASRPPTSSLIRQAGIRI